MFLLLTLPICLFATIVLLAAAIADVALRSPKATAPRRKRLAAVPGLSETVTLAPQYVPGVALLAESRYVISH
jgi:hypothetical protein